MGAALDPLSDVERTMRDLMSTKPRDGATQSVRELGWVFSSFGPDPTIVQNTRSPIPWPNAGIANMNPAEARHRVNQRYHMDVLDRNNTHFSNITQARTEWFFNIPLSKVEGTRAEEIIHLLLYDYRSGQIHHLRVPTSYLRDNMPNLRVRRDTNAIDLHLSTENYKLFQDKSSECRFQHLVCPCSG
jgi:hypothetical protein